MDAELLIAALAGALLGLVASALPGLHVNLLATAVLVARPQPQMAPFLVAAFAASPFGMALSSTFLGGPSDDAALSSLPAQQLAKEGRVREAVALQCWGALLGLLLALPLALAVRALLVPLAPHLASAMPWLLLAIVALLVWSEPRTLRWPARVPWGSRMRIEDIDVSPGSRALGRAAALGVIVLSGALGLAAFRLGAASPLGWPASPLLPLLAGMFALPALVATARAPPKRVRALLRAPRERMSALVRGAWPGAAVSVTLGLVPGVSASHASLLAPRVRSPERALVRLAAVNGGAVVFTLLAWHALGRARSGALVAAQTLAAPALWVRIAPPHAILVEGALVVAAALLACLATRAVAGSLARAPPRPLALVGLALLLASVALFNGALGLLVLGAAALVGALPARAGLRRSHLMGAILVPAMLRAWSLV
ncbi:MAG TPA: tripartite tricarboxylate transporter permease [Candidatus Thermoplasmatota archaeon]|nr:tripartite tricarboxylate transporter permease [Candidatus Thermoplasmatota archaeon]